MTKTVLVTGGAGFIGANHIYYLLEAYSDIRVVCLDKLTYAGNIENLDKAMHDARFRFVQGDITDRSTVDALFAEENFDTVINFAAESHVDRSIEDPQLFLHTNILGTAVLLDACRQYKVRRFHQVSTDEVYGDLPLDRPDLFFTESTPLHTSSPYSASKASADLLCLSYFRTFGTPVTVSRCSNNYGPFQFPEKLIPLMCVNAMTGKKLPVYGNGLNVRDWLYVKDHCRAIDIICQDGKPGEVYNVGGHNEKTNITIVKTVLRLLGKGEESITYVTDRPGHDRRYAIDPKKIESELHWQPLTGFEEGMKQTVNWYAENRTWWEHILQRQ